MKYNRAARAIVLPDAELEAFAAEYERTTGKCYDCDGSGKVFARWSKADGVEYRTCPACAGSRNAPK